MNTTQRAIEAIERIRELHRPYTVDVMDMPHWDGSCDCEEDCPRTPTIVCYECDGHREAANEEAAVVAYPCLTIRKIDGEPAPAAVSPVADKEADDA